MATFVFQKQQMVAGARRESDPVTVPEGLTEARVDLDMNTVELRDPTTLVRGILEFRAPAGTGLWRHLASTELQGKPENNPGAGNEMPHILVGASTLAQLHALQAEVRGVVEAGSDGNYGATLTWQ